MIPEQEYSSIMRYQNIMSGIKVSEGGQVGNRVDALVLYTQQIHLKESDTT